MRPVDKGTRNDSINPYQLALEPLTKKLGRYCSYCEMQVYNSLEVEHVVSISKGGDKHQWHNFLLACKHCNGSSNKSDKVSSRTNYFWPDKDNTFLAFDYDELQHIRPHSGLSQVLQPIAKATIGLLGLDRFPGSINPPTLGDKRYIKRNEVWALAKESLSDWYQMPVQEMIRQIIRTATGHGFFSIWMTVFKDIPEIKLALIDAFPGTAKNCFDQNGNPAARPGGKI
ncbi:MAG: HNH endonuclease [Saprospiraceae bacterium]|nr:HNH endonuclease [Saprospiraceae bacterium]